MPSGKMKSQEVGEVGRIVCGKSLCDAEGECWTWDSGRICRMRCSNLLMNLGSGRPGSRPSWALMVLAGIHTLLLPIP